MDGEHPPIQRRASRRTGNASNQIRLRLAGPTSSTSSGSALLGHDPEVFELARRAHTRERVEAEDVGAANGAIDGMVLTVSASRQRRIQSSGYFQ